MAVINRIKTAASAAAALSISVAALGQQPAPEEGETIIVTGQARMEVIWEKCSEKLAQATSVERSIARLSPSGSSIHWPLVDEDLAVGPLVMGR